MAQFNITIAGDSALNLEFARLITPETSSAIRLAAQNLTADPIEGITELVPTFCSLMVYYNPLIVSFDELSYRLKSKLRDLEDVHTHIKKIIEIPVCYGGDFGPDMETICLHTKLSMESIIEIHSSRDYLIDMLGFLPGFAYLGGLDSRLYTPRLAEPRTRIEAGSVGIGGTQTGIYPLPSPGGWQIIGRSPLRPYDPDRENPILYAAGEYLRFVPISFDEYGAIETQLSANTYHYQIHIVEDE